MAAGPSGLPVAVDLVERGAVLVVQVGGVDVLADADVVRRGAQEVRRQFDGQVREDLLEGLVARLLVECARRLVVQRTVVGLRHVAVGVDRGVPHPEDLRVPRRPGVGVPGDTDEHVPVRDRPGPLRRAGVTDDGTVLEVLGVLVRQRLRTEVLREQVLATLYLQGHTDTLEIGLHLDGDVLAGGRALVEVQRRRRLLTVGAEQRDVVTAALQREVTETPQFITRLLDVLLGDANAVLVDGVFVVVLGPLGLVGDGGVGQATLDLLGDDLLVDDAGNRPSTGLALHQRVPVRALVEEHHAQERLQRLLDTDVGDGLPELADVVCRQSVHVALTVAEPLEDGRLLGLVVELVALEVRGVGPRLVDLHDVAGLDVVAHVVVLVAGGGERARVSGRAVLEGVRPGVAVPGEVADLGGLAQCLGVGGVLFEQRLR